MKTTKGYDGKYRNKKGVTHEQLIALAEGRIKRAIKAGKSSKTDKALAKDMAFVYGWDN